MNRRIIIIIVLLLIALLAAASIVIGLRLSSNKPVTPGDAEAATCGNPGTVSYARCGANWQTQGSETCATAAIRLGCYSTGTDVGCFQRSCPNATRFICYRSTAQEVMDEYYNPQGCTQNPQAATAQLPSGICGFWQDDCNSATSWQACDPKYPYIGGYDTSGCGVVVTTPPVTTPPVTTPPVTSTPTPTPTPNPLCGDGKLDPGEICDPGSASTNTCGDGLSCLPTCNCEVETDDVEVNVQKTGSDVCLADNTSSVITYTVTVENNGDDIRVDVIDQLDTAIVPYIDEASITGGGQFVQSDGDIVWLSVDIPEGDTVQYTYTATVPATLFGDVLTNTVIVMSPTDEEYDRATATITAGCDLPETALISDWADRVMIGLFLIIIGALTYRLDLQNKSWNLFKKLGGNYILALFRDEERNKITDKKINRFEKKILQKD